MQNETRSNLERLFVLYPGVNAGYDLDDPEKLGEFHWYLSSCLGWNCGPYLHEEIKIRRSEDSGTISAESANLFLIPGKWDTTNYKINNGQPDIDGLVYITKLEWANKK